MKKRLVLTATIAVVLVFLCSCGGASSSKGAPPSLQSISVSVASDKMIVGETRQCTATAVYSDGSTKNVSSSATWSTSNASVAQVSSSGAVTAAAVGSATITASLGGRSSTASVTVSAALNFITISPSLSSASVGDSIALTATGTYSDSSTKDLTSLVTWASSNVSVATVSGSGVLAAIAAGDTTISATVSGISGTLSLHVSASKTVVSIAVAASPTAILVGETSQFSAVATYDDSTSADVTTVAQWSSAAPGIASVNQSGLATGVSVGSVAIQAAVGGVNGHANLTVNPLLISIDIAPLSPALVPNTTMQLTANGRYSDGSQRDLTALVEWSSTDVSIATIDHAGVVTGVAAGTSSISARLNGIVGTTNLTVRSPELQSILIDQDGITIIPGAPQQLTATGVFSDGTTSQLHTVTWSSSDPSIVSIDTDGLASALTVGSVTATATSGSVSGDGTLNAGAAVLRSVALAPLDPSLPLGLTQQFTLVGTFSDRTTQNITGGVTWESSDTSIATVDNSGLASSLDVGSTVIKATVGQLNASSTLTVTSAAVASIALDPDQVSLPAGVTQQFTAKATYTDGSSQNLPNADWSSNDGTIATVSNSGLATGRHAGQTQVTASFGGVQGSATITVTPALLTGLTIAPEDMSAPRGNRIQFAATGTYSDSTSADLTQLVLWTSSAPQTLSIDSNGLALARQTGTATVTAEFEGQSAQVVVTVVPPGMGTSDAAAPVILPLQGAYTNPQTVTITSATPGVWIYYTTDGTFPTTASALYSGPFTVSHTTTIKAIAAGGSYNSSNVTSATFTIAAAAPTFSPSSGVYLTPQSVTITSTTPGTSIYYTTDGSTPTTASTLYSAPLPVSTTTTIRAIAAGGNYGASALAFATFTIAAAAPVISPASGGYLSPQTVTITTTTSGASIYYTTDGSTPTTASTLYSGSFTISNATVKAIAAGGGYGASLITSATFTNAAATPAISPSSGTYFTPQSVSITTSTSGASIYYTTDGSTPTIASTVYTAPFLVSTTTTVRAIAAGGGYTASALVFATFTIVAADPLISPASGTYFTPQTVTITSSTPGASIHYTIDGSTPTAASTVYSAPFAVNTTTTVKAIAAGGGYGASAVASATFTIAAAAPEISPSSGSYQSPQTITITSSTPGTSIYYTTDGSSPTTASTVYTVPFTVSITTTVKAIAAGGSYSASTIASAAFTIAAAAPAISPSSGSYLTPQTVTITTSTPGTSIYYTTDGSSPTIASTLYAGSFPVNSTTTVKAVAAGGGYGASAVSSATFTIGPE